MSAWETRIGPEDAASLLRRLEEMGSPFSDERALVIHDLDLLVDRFDELADAFPARSLHSVAVKANPLVELLRVLVGRGAGLEAASLEEAHVAIAAGCPPERIVFDSPAKTRHELLWALERGLTVNVDNLDELERALDLPAHPAARLGVRVVPGVGSGTIEATSVGGRWSRFGVSIADMQRHVAPLMRAHPMIRGLHVHVGSQGQPLRHLVDAARVVDELVAFLRSDVGADAIEFVDLGGGLSTVYDSSTRAPTIKEYATELRSAVPRLMDGSVEIVTEFGRSLLAGVGIALSRVEYTKHVGGVDVAVGHLGADFLVRTAYAPDQWRHEFFVIRADGRLAAESERTWTVAGPLCFAGDVIGRDVPLGELEPGDWLGIRDVGAYSLSMWSRHCSRGMPIALGERSRDGSVDVLRAAERPDDVARFWSRDGLSAAHRGPTGARAASDGELDGPPRLLR